MRALLTTKGLIGLTLVVLFTALAIVAPFTVPEELSTRINVLARLKPPSLEHPLGTDQLGRELLWRVLLGAYTSLTIAVSAVLLSIVIGLPAGIVAGYYGGWADTLLMPAT